ncbi:MAG: DNA-3-methyladenine glycosylase I [Treponema sp.]|nr:DNA-3-methyladenine glycosylase I [Treponema sp.]
MVKKQPSGPDIVRCPWCLGDPDYIRYHDREWGVPLKNSRKLFEFLVLDGAQAGLSWLTILKRREGYRLAFDGFDPEKMAAYTEKDIKRLLNDGRIIRNRLKIRSAIGNARAYCEMKEAGEDFGKWLWNFVDGKPLVNRRKTLAEIPASTELSEKISKELKNRGFTFVGPTIIYAFIQAAGLVNDHLVDCFRYKPFF